MDQFDLLLAADQLRDFLHGQGLTDVRVAGLLASGRPLLGSVPVELYVVPPSPDWTAGDLGRVGREAGTLIGHPVLLLACPVGQEPTLPGEAVTWL